MAALRPWGQGFWRPSVSRTGGFAVWGACELGIQGGLQHGEAAGGNYDEDVEVKL